MREATLLHRSGSMGWVASLTLASSLALVGCTPIQVWMGWRVRLEKTPIASMAATLPKGAMAPGDSAPLVVTVVQPDGTALQTEGVAGGKVLWEDLQITATVVAVSPKGIISLPADPRLSDGRTPHLTISVPSHPGLQTELGIAVRYDGAFNSNFSGSPGMSGMDGSAGSDGMSGSMGSFDPNNPSPGGDGSDGSNGSDGQDGGPGGDAPSVLVNVAFRPGVRPLLQVSVTGGGRVDRFLVDPQGGSLTIKAEGGPGCSTAARISSRVGSRGLRRFRNPQWFKRPRRDEWTGWLRWISRKGGRHHRGLRPPGQALPGEPAVLQPEGIGRRRPGPGAYGGSHAAPMVRGRFLRQGHPLSA